MESDGENRGAPLGKERKGAVQAVGTSMAGRERGREGSLGIQQAWLPGLWVGVG